MADNREIWKQRTEYLTALHYQYTKASAKVSMEHIENVLSAAKAVVTRLPYPGLAARMMAIDEYNLAWKEYLERHRN